MLRLLYLIFSIAMLAACSPPAANQTITAYHYHPDSAFNAHWYDGLAEVNRYELTQNRYGQLRSGDAVLIFVTETHNSATHVKVNNPQNGDLPVLKLNHYRRFPTGIYPYTFITSTFSPVDTSFVAYPTRITHSMQEWCGQIYMQVDCWDKNTWQYQLHSYFANESLDTSLPITYTEDGLLNLIRTAPEQFPRGSAMVVPAAHHLRFTHQPWQPQETKCTVISNTTWTYSQDTLQQFQLVYPMANREVNYFAASSFPYQIAGWEVFSKGKLESRGVLTDYKRIPYWQLNTLSDTGWADTLGITTQ